MKDYKKLEAVNEYDKEKLEELVEAMNELRQLESRANYLKELIEQHSELHEFVWGTADGKLLAFHTIEDDHLKNIMTHCVNSGRRIPKGIKAEARERGFEVPDDSQEKLLAYRAEKLLESDNDMFGEW